MSFVGSSCSSGTSCPTGEAIVPAPPGVLTCAPCGADTFSENNLCVTCAATAGSCTGDGFALTASCGEGEGSDVSVCTNCTLLDLVPSNSGRSCISASLLVGDSTEDDEGGVSGGGIAGIAIAAGLILIAGFVYYNNKRSAGSKVAAQHDDGWDGGERVLDERYDAEQVGP